MPGPHLDSFSPARRSIILFLKTARTVTVAEVAEELDVSYEGARQQLLQLEREGWVGRTWDRRSQRTGGRPSASFSLTENGESLFPKAYDLLSIEVIDAVMENFGIEGLQRILSQLTEARVKRWKPLLEGLDLKGKLKALRSLYLAEDPFLSVEEDEQGFLLVERNCPFLNVANARPALCSVTVSCLRQLLGVAVIREERFQQGHGRCAFRVLPDRALEPHEMVFELENPPAEETKTRR